MRWFFGLAFGENPLSRLLPELAPFAPEPTIVTTSVEEALSSFEAETPLQATVATMTDIAKEASEYAHDGYAFPLGGHQRGDGSWPTSLTGHVGLHSTTNTTLDQFHPAVADCLGHAFGQWSKIQREASPQIKAGDHTFIGVPIGWGKTIPAFFCAIDNLAREAEARPLPDETRIVCIAPLKALSNDIERSLQAPLASILERRGGDDASSRIPASLPSFGSTLLSSKDYVGDFVSDYGGGVWIWSEFGSILLFPFDGKAAEAIECAVRFMLFKHLYYIEESSFPDLISVRLAPPVGNVMYHPDQTGQVISDALNRTFHLSQRHTLPGSFAVTEEAFAYCPTELRGYFTPAAEFEDCKVLRMNCAFV